MTDTVRAAGRARAVGRGLRRVLLYEGRMWLSLFRWILRVPPTREPGAAAFGYAGAQTPVLVAFIVVSAIEVPVVHLLLMRWPAVRNVALALGVYGVLWMLGLLAMQRTHPHLVTGEGLRLRGGATVDVSVPWSDVVAVRARDRTWESNKGVQVDGDSLNLVVMKYTNVEVELRAPTPLRVSRTRTERVSLVRCCADDPDALVTRARERC